MAIGDRVRERREALGMNQLELSRAVAAAGGSLSQAQISGLEAGTVKRPRALPELASALQTTVEWLLESKARATAASQTQRNSHDIDITMRRALRQGDTPPAPLVLYRTVHLDKGRGGDFMLSVQPAGEVERPDFLRYSLKAFAVKVLNEANNPAYRVRDVVLIDPDSAAIESEDCCFTGDVNSTGGAVSVIGCLVSSTATCWKVRQYAVKGERELLKSEFPNAWPIVGRYNRR